MASGGRVAPLAGAWIEINPSIPISGQAKVAPLAGAWIEISNLDNAYKLVESRSPRGSVD